MQSCRSDSGVEYEPRRKGWGFKNFKERLPGLRPRTRELFYRLRKSATPIPPNSPSRTAGAYVTFRPGARSAWHTHPLGQTLIVTEGIGRVQQWGGVVQAIRLGDVVWTPPGVKHWHGASPKSSMTHMAVQEQLDGKVVDWMEKVSDEQYNSSIQGDDRKQ
ncbi:cupin domain protein [Leptospira fainei serovar Hurstbridge str. BUT 6]|uniref:Cupin domain protein n=1 Tax=Leptospira fainei serovar Hurstbridge str. BUT 6 TaxID=1193011 RepID=S3V1H5_9LEPT|nr:cupin domain-containing protein [Leptospira fainei]EPG75293.1 cupin domain protein [Leptospira fainei serovar Hurstbridge str. BUT 6]